MTVLHPLVAVSEPYPLDHHFPVFPVQFLPFPSSPGRWGQPDWLLATTRMEEGEEGKEEEESMEEDAGMGWL